MLDAAGRRFQEQHGVAADGVAGLATQAALDSPVSDRIRAEPTGLNWASVQKDASTPTNACRPGAGSTKSLKLIRMFAA